MRDEAAVDLAKAEESLAGAVREFAAGRDNNRASDACFQAAAAPIRADVLPGGDRGTWDHAFVRGRFSGHLVNRRTLYPAHPRDTLRDAAAPRQQGDDRSMDVNEGRAARVLGQARLFVKSVASDGGRRS